MTLYGSEIVTTLFEEKMVTPSKKRKMETVEEDVVNDTLERASTSTSQFLMRSSPTEFELNPIWQGVALRSVNVWNKYKTFMNLNEVLKKQPFKVNQVFKLRRPGTVLHSSKCWWMLKTLRLVEKRRSGIGKLGAVGKQPVNRFWATSLILRTWRLRSSLDRIHHWSFVARTASS